MATNKGKTQNNQEKKDYEDFQIIRLDGRDKFVESLSRAFDINKVVLNFIHYDDKRKAGERIQQQVTIYVDFSKFRRFAQDMLSGRYAQLAKANKPIFSDLTGTPAEKLKQYGRERKDGKAESRKLSLAPSAKGFFITGESGPGEKTETGMIKPAGKTESRVSIPIDGDQAKELVLSTIAAMDAYETAKETTKQVEALLKSKNIIK